ncbi:hypothetical protein PAXRUDRAFT_78570, partial [Paxillus rubicundulus Ve08.2h10]
MLLIFKPWRSFEDLKTGDECWSSAFDDYAMPANMMEIVENMNIEQECKDAK